MPDAKRTMSFPSSTSHLPAVSFSSIQLPLERSDQREFESKVEQSLHYTLRRAIWQGWAAWFESVVGEGQVSPKVVAKIKVWNNKSKRNGECNGHVWEACPGKIPFSKRLYPSCFCDPGPTRTEMTGQGMDTRSRESRSGSLRNSNHLTKVIFKVAVELRRLLWRKGWERKGQRRTR